MTKHFKIKDTKVKSLDETLQESEILIAHARAFIKEHNKSRQEKGHDILQLPSHDHVSIDEDYLNKIKRFRETPDAYRNEYFRMFENQKKIMNCIWDLYLESKTKVNSEINNQINININSNSDLTTKANYYSAIKEENVNGEMTKEIEESEEDKMMMKESLRDFKFTIPKFIDMVDRIVDLTHMDLR